MDPSSPHPPARSPLESAALDFVDAELARSAAITKYKAATGDHALDVDTDNLKAEWAAFVGTETSTRIVAARSELFKLAAAARETAPLLRPRHALDAMGTP